MDNEDDELVEVLKRSGLEGKHFEAKGVSRGEFEALKRFGIYKQLVDGTLMRIEGDKEYRIYLRGRRGMAGSSDDAGLLQHALRVV